jgi:RecJ-like exonuclease
MPHRRFYSMDQELAQPTGVKEPCARCRAKGIVVCPTCQGTGDIRNESYVVVDRCHDCSKDLRGFITCPSCLGEKEVEIAQLRRSYRLERERMRSIPAVWGYKNPAFLSSLAPSATREKGADQAPSRR